MSEEEPEQGSGGGSLGWIIAGLVIGFLLLNRAAPATNPWDVSPGEGPSERTGGQYYGNQEPQYEPGTYGDFWARERAAERGEPVRPSTGILLKPSTGVPREDPEKVRLADEVDRLRAENERLRRQAGGQ